MSKFDEDDVRAWLCESLTPQDLRPSRYTEKVCDSLTPKLHDSIAAAIDDVFGDYVAQSNSTYDELYTLAEQLTATLSESDVWKTILKRIKGRELDVE